MGNHNNINIFEDPSEEEAFPARGLHRSGIGANNMEGK
jgi:hypothetical protein